MPARGRPEGGGLRGGASRTESRLDTVSQYRSGTITVGYGPHAALRKSKPLYSAGVNRLMTRNSGAVSLVHSPDTSSTPMASMMTPLTAANHW